MIEISQIELEQLEADIAASRQRFLIELTKHPELAALYSRMVELEHAGIDARRARREAEIREGGTP